MATYKEIKKGNWRAEEGFGYLQDGKQDKVRKQGFKTKREAVEWIRAQTEQRRKGFVETNASKILFKDYLLKWFYDYKSIPLSQNTKNNYLSRINTYIIPKLGDYKLNEINNVVIQDFYNSLIKQSLRFTQKGLSPSSAKKVMEILNGVFRYAQKSKLILTIPLDIEKQPLDKPELEVWTKEELDCFLQKVEGDYLHLPVFFESLIGARPGELCGLKWIDVDLDNAIIHIKRQALVDRNTGNLYLTDTLKTTTSARTITIPKILVNYLKKIKENRDAKETDFIILELSNPNPQNPCNSNNLNANFTKKINSIVSKNKDIKLSYISLNGLRHTHTTLLVQIGENIKVISKRLGHTDINTTLKYYTHVTTKMETNTANLLDNFFGK